MWDISGLSWLGVAQTATFPPFSTASHAQPEPNWVAAALEKASLKASKEPKAASMALESSAEGVVFLGVRICQNKLWL